MDGALERFEHPAAHRELQWNLKDAASVVRSRLGHLDNARQQALIEHCMRHFEAEVAPKLPSLRSSIIHNDGNDHNLLVAGRGPQQQVTGIIDFGDMLYTCTVCDLAIAAAYAIMGQRDPVTAAGHVVAGYHEAFPLTESELEVLYGLICARLATSVALSAEQQKLEPDNPYLSISERDAWQTLEHLAAIKPAFAHFAFRSACGLPPCPSGGAVVGWLRENHDRFAPVVAASLKGDETLVFDLSVGSPEIEDVAVFLNATAFSEVLFDRMRMSGARAGVGRYDEARLWYCSDAYRTVRDGCLLYTSDAADE